MLYMKVLIQRSQVCNKVNRVLAWMNNFNHIMVLYIWDKVNFTLGLKDTVKSRVSSEKVCTVKKIDHSLKHVKTNLRFFGLSQSFYSRFQNNLTEAELKNKNLSQIKTGQNKSEVFWFEFEVLFQMFEFLFQILQQFHIS